jgi:hypothetical protein
MTVDELKFLDEPTFNDYLQRLIKTKGELEGTGLVLQDIRNMIYTRRLKIDPNVEAAVEKAKETKSTNRKKVSGINVDDFLS